MDIASASNMPSQFSQNLLSHDSQKIIVAYGDQDYLSTHSHQETSSDLGMPHTQLKGPSTDYRLTADEVIEGQTVVEAQTDAFNDGISNNTLIHPGLKQN